MATYIPPKRATEFIFYVGLVSQANTKVLQANPTLAAGDVTVTKDGGASANLTTLPTVTPASGKRVKVTVSATEMTADNITIVFSDAAGAEWCDLIVNFQTSARQVDDLAFPNTSGRGIDVDATGGVEITTGQSVASVTGAVGSVTGAVGSVAAGGITATSIATGAIDADALAADAVAEIAAAILATPANLLATDASGRVTVGSNADKTGYAIGVGGIAATAFAAAAIDAAAIAADAIGSSELALSAAQEIADELLKRDMSAVTGEAARSPLNALRFLRNKWVLSGGALSVKKEDDTTEAWNAAVTTTAGDPVSTVDPA